MTRPLLVAIYTLASSQFAGCAQMGTIYRESDLHTGRSIIIDAQQRLITNMNVEEDTFYGRIRPRRIVCAEPSPDVAAAVSRALSTALEASLQRPDETNINAGGNGTFATATSIVQLGERIATIQLLRDELSDLCRSYANGAVSTTTYTLRLSKLDTKMVTLLMGEMAAGAFGRPLNSVSGHASTSQESRVSSEEWSHANERLAHADERVRHRSEELEHAQGEKRARAHERLEDAIRELHEASERITALAHVSASAAVASAGGDANRLAGYVGAGGDRSEREVGRQLVQLQRQFLDNDELSTLVDACVTALDLRERKSGDGEQREAQLLRDSRQAAARRIESLERQRSTLIRQKSERDADLSVLTDQRSRLLDKISSLEIAPASELLPDPNDSPSEVDPTAGLNLREDARSARTAELDRSREQLRRVDANLGAERTRGFELQSALDAVQQDIDAKRNDMLFEPTRTRSDLGVYCTEHMDDIRGMVAEQRREVTQLRRLEIETRRAEARFDFCKTVLASDVTALPHGVQNFCADPDAFSR